GSGTADKDARLCQVASVNDEVVGFVLGDIRGEEFDLPPCGWILNVGVRPAYRNQKIGQRLLSKLLDYIASQNISTVRTMVGWENAEMLSFFGSLGFDCGPYLPLEKRLH
ncbi:MAG: GNAT family N-acetyltransferase, partial [Chloroflexota bacterium]|nr:GNAT family N-acetyltransferase [Chloroflexota bacterium]